MLQSLHLAEVVGITQGHSAAYWVSVAAFGPKGHEFDAHSLLRFQLPDEAWRSEQLITVISVTTTHVAVQGRLFTQHGGV